MHVMIEDPRVLRQLREVGLAGWERNETKTKSSQVASCYY